MIAYIVISVIGLLLVVLDQAVKAVICNVFPGGESTVNNEIVVIEDFFDIVRWHNTGGAWGMLGDYTWLLTAFTLICIVIILYAYISAESSFFKLSLALILAGAIGNVIDRIRLGYVVDFLSFDNLFGYSFPAFNVADICVVAGSIGLLIFVIFLSRKKEAFREGTFLRRLFAEETGKSEASAETSSEEEV